MCPPLSLQQYAGKGLGGNRMAHEFSVRSLEGAVEFAALEMVADGEGGGGHTTSA